MEPEIKVGETYLFHGRMIYIGKVKRVSLRVVVVTQCGWMADMGIRMGELLKSGPVDATDIEWSPPEMEVQIPIGAFAIYPWPHAR